VERLKAERRRCGGFAHRQRTPSLPFRSYTTHCMLILLAFFFIAKTRVLVCICRIRHITQSYHNNVRAAPPTFRDSLAENTVTRRADAHVPYTHAAWNACGMLRMITWWQPHRVCRVLRLVRRMSKARGPIDRTSYNVPSSPADVRRAVIVNDAAPGCTVLKSARSSPSRSRSAASKDAPSALHRFSFAPSCAA
jgi:hypothetical protein